MSIVKRSKLTQQKSPPYEVLEVMASGHALRLDIPPHLHIHPVVSIQHVEPCGNPRDDPWARKEEDLTEPGPANESKEDP